MTTETVTDERLATLIAWAEECSKPWISVDVPAALRELQSLRAKVKGRIELRPDDYADKSIMDEIVAENCRVHLERMDEHWYCLIVETDERRVMVNIGTPDRFRRKVNAKVYEDAAQGKGRE